MMKRQADGTGWVVLFNSSAWNGPEINSYVNNLMYRVVSELKNQPERDLLDYSLPVPLTAGLSDQ